MAKGKSSGWVALSVKEISRKAGAGAKFRALEARMFDDEEFPDEESLDESAAEVTCPHCGEVIDRSRWWVAPGIRRGL
jgi:hypothetical protein